VLSVVPTDGSAVAGAKYGEPGATEPGLPQLPPGDPAIVQASCGQAPSVTRLEIPDPLVANQATAPLIAADPGGGTAAVAANAVNDAWAATTAGAVVQPTTFSAAPTRPHLYRWTDGTPPVAPPGDDVETRPTIFVIDAPVFVPAPPQVVTVPITVKTKKRHTKTRQIKLKPSVYAVHSTLHRGPNGKVTLNITFKVRRPVTIGIEALRGKKVVASSGLKHFKGHSGELTLTLNAKLWPTHLRFVVPKKSRARQ
jgi:hypothetical protein